MLKRFVLFLFIALYITTHDVMLPFNVQAQSQIENRGKDGDDDGGDNSGGSDNSGGGSDNSGSGSDDSGGGSDNSGGGSDNGDDSGSGGSDNSGSGDDNSGNDNSGSDNSGNDNSGSGDDNSSSGSDNSGSDNDGSGSNSGGDNSGNGGSDNSGSGGNSGNGNNGNGNNGNGGDNSGNGNSDDNNNDSGNDNSGNDNSGNGNLGNDDKPEGEAEDNSGKDDGYKEDDRHYYVGSVSANDGSSILMGGTRLESTSPWLEILDTGMLFEAYGFWQSDDTFIADEINVLSGEDWAYVRAPGVLLGEADEQIEAWTRSENIETARAVSKEVAQDSVRVVAYFDGSKVRGLPAALTPPTLPALPSGWVEFTGRFDGDGVVWDAPRPFP